jgi:hypothetical protein
MFAIADRKEMNERRRYRRNQSHVCIPIGTNTIPWNKEHACLLFSVLIDHPCRSIEVEFT